MDPRILKALETWHGGFDEDGKRNCALSLMGEVGELCNLYRKKFYKPNYTLNRETVLQELGDIWYYIRIFAHLNSIEDLGELNKLTSFTHNSIECLVRLYEDASEIGFWSEGRGSLAIITQEVPNHVIRMSYRIIQLLKDWDCSLDELTELNYQKLTKNEDHHGWKNVGVDYAKGKDESIVGFWRVEENGNSTLIGTSNESFEELKEKLSQEEYKMLDEGNWSEYEDLGDENEPPLVQAEEDWREGMQKRIALLKQESIEKRGRWY